MLDCWLRSAAKIIVDAKYEFVKVLAARAASQTPVLPRLEPGMGWMARQAKAYKTDMALSDAKFLLAQLRREAKINAEGVVPTSATAPRVVIEVQRRRKCLVWNPGGVRVIDSRADRRLSDRERARQAKRRASGAGAQADERDRELAAALEREDAEDGGGDVGRGSALRFKGCDALEAIIADVKSKDAHLLVLSETHLHGSAVEDVADYLGTRLGWQDLAKGRSGGAPEYSPWQPRRLAQQFVAERLARAPDDLPERHRRLHRSAHIGLAEIRERIGNHLPGQHAFEACECS